MPDHDTKNYWVISFGPFRVTPARRLVERNGEPLRLGSRAFDVLVYLLEHAGQVISHRDLLDAVWPGTYVEEGNLRFQMATLRKALGEGEASYIINVPGRGYCFTAPISRQDESRYSANANPGTGQLAAFPRAPRLVGRDKTVAHIADLVRENRIVSIVATGGMGKTAVAMAAANHLRRDFADEICIVELSQAHEPDGAGELLAAGLGLHQAGEHSLPAMLKFLRDRHMLIVLDGCEHIVGSSAILVERLIEQTAGVHVLVTSREALRIDREKVFVLEPLASPRPCQDQSAAVILAYPAVQLFVEKVRATGNSVAVEREAKYIAETCARLDGLALAIEVVASQAAAIGLDKLPNLIEDGSFLAWPGRRTGAPRHQSLRAMLDWSYRLLSDSEKRALRRISVFSGQFDLEAASAMTRNELAGLEIASVLVGLASKSLLALIRTDQGTRYWLPGTIKAYARSKLSEANEEHAVRRRHAYYYVQSLQNLKLSELGQDQLKSIQGELEDMRAAILWAFSPAGDLSLAVSLAADTIPVLNQANVFQEARQPAMRHCTRQSGGIPAPKPGRVALTVVPR